MTSIIYQPISLEWANEKDNCNSSNHCDLDDTPTFDKYLDSIISSSQSRWMKEFPIDNVITCTFSNNDMIKLLEMNDNMLSTKEYDNDVFNDLVSKMPDITNTTKYFVRTDYCSLKDGYYGNIGFDSNEKILLNLITSKRINFILNMLKNKNLTEINIYYCSWDYNYENKYEFRIFWHKGKITAISQYIWFEDFYDIYHNIEDYTNEIIAFCQQNTTKINKLYESCTIDVILVIDESQNVVVKLIEFGPFGKETPVGSCLFHWLNDNDLLINDKGDIYVRYVTLTQFK